MKSHFNSKPVEHIQLDINSSLTKLWQNVKKMLLSSSFLHFNCCFSDKRETISPPWFSFSETEPLDKWHRVLQARYESYHPSDSVRLPKHRQYYEDKFAAKDQQRLTLKNPCFITSSESLAPEPSRFSGFLRISCQQQKTSYWPR